MFTATLNLGSFIIVMVTLIVLWKSLGKHIMPKMVDTTITLAEAANSGAHSLKNVAEATEVQSFTYKAEAMAEAEKALANVDVNKVNEFVNSIRKNG